MAKITMKQCLEAGVHFGHQTRRWNPRMQPYIFQKRKGIYIIDLQKTVQIANRVLEIVKQMASEGKVFLFVGTKKQAQSSIEENAKRCNMPYVSQRWLGGLLTNFEVVKKSIEKLKRYEELEDSEELSYMTKKEYALFKKRLEKLRKNVGGLKNLEKLPDALFIVDIKREEIAVKEARKLGIPVFALVDTNCNPELVDYPIPANDDAIRAINLFCTAFADAIIEGRRIFEASESESEEVKEVENEEIKNEKTPEESPSDQEEKKSDENENEEVENG